MVKSKVEKKLNEKVNSNIVKKSYLELAAIIFASLCETHDGLG